MAEKEKLSKEEKAAQNAVIKEIMADFGLEGVTKKRLSRYHREQRELGQADDRVPAQAGADCRDVRGEASLELGWVFWRAGDERSSACRRGFWGGSLSPCFSKVFLYYWVNGIYEWKVSITQYKYWQIVNYTHLIA